MNKGPLTRVDDLLQEAVDDMGGGSSSGDGNSYSGSKNEGDRNLNQTSYLNPPNNERSLGRDVYNSVAGRMSSHDMANWMPSGEAFAVRDGKLSILVGSSFMEDWLRDHYFNVISSAAEEVIGGEVEICYTIDGEKYKGLKPDIHSPPPEVAGQIIGSDGKPKDAMQGTMPVVGEGYAPRRPRFVYDTSSPEFKLEAAKPNLPYEEHKSRAFYIKHSGNELARGVCRKVLERLGNGERGKFPTVWIGENGCGKTSLTARLMYEALAKGVLPGYLDVGELNQAFKSSQGKHKVEGYFTDKKRRLIVIDSSEELVRGSENRPGVQRAVDSILRPAMEHGKEVVMVYAGAREEYEAMIPIIAGGEVPKLAATLERLPKIPMFAPDKEGQKSMIESAFRLHGLEAAKKESLEDIAAAVASSIPEWSSAKYIMGQAETIAAAADALDRPLSLDILKYAGVKEPVPTAIPVRDPTGFIQTVAEETGISVSQMKSRRKTRVVVQARRLAIHSIHEHFPELSLQDIGNQFGGKDHTTILYSLDNTTDAERTRSEELFGVP
ncbi:hypothetical protein KAR91_87810, partial [Candidatus Pacearchaeota archaeon]|nr:hypothetical protein [Candidatus Pacearchaeota archaeon]